MSVELIRGLYDYHRWANRRLFDVASALGEDLAARDVGKQFSYSTIGRMFGHLYGADRIWLSRWTGVSPATIPGAEFATLASIRAPWDDLERPVNYTSGLFGNRPFQLRLGVLMQHVANHATHHRSEIATMITMISSSPPSTDRVVYDLIATGQIV